MRKIFVASVITLLAFCGSALAADKANQGSCVNDCVQAFNHSLEDKGIDAEKVGTFTQKECVDWCKNKYVTGQGYFWADGVCNPNYTSTDPDCPKAPPPPPPGIPGGSVVKKTQGAPCQSGEECESGVCIPPPLMPGGFPPSSFGKCK